MNDEKQMMTITLEDGSQEEVEILVSFEFKDTLKQYVVYTKNEVDEKGNVTVYVSTIIGNAEDPEAGDVKLGKVETDEEWSRIKEVLKSLSKKEEE